MKYGIFSANEFLYTDSKIENGKQEIKLFAAQKSYAMAQVLIDAKCLLKCEWRSDSLDNPQIFKMIPVYVDKNTGSSTAASVFRQGTEVDYAPKLAPFWVYDALEPIDDIIECDESGNVALYIRFSTHNLKSGSYCGEIIFADESGNECIAKIQIVVTNAVIPEKETLRITNWYHLNYIPKFHGVEEWSEEHWAIIEKYGRLMREARQTDFWLLKDMIAETKTEDGKYLFDFSKVERHIKLYLSLGFSYIEGPMFYCRKAWEHSDFIIKINGEAVPALSEVGYEYARAFFTQLYTFLKKNGWFEIFTAHVGDEPQKNCTIEYRILSGWIRKWMPGVKIIEAVETPDLDGAVDIWVPKSDRYLTYKEEFDRKIARGEDEFWFYTCMFPGGHHLNRLLDQELLRTRYLHWANYVYGFTGYLHWGLNIYEQLNGNSVFSGACDRPDGVRMQILPAGDTHIVYPKGEQVLRSVRLEMMRAGCEDYELLKLIEKQDKQKADEIAQKCVRSFTDYTKDVNAFEETHRFLLEQF